MQKFIVERADGETDRVEADFFNCNSGVITFYEIIGPYEQGKIVRAYPFRGVICVIPYEEEEQAEEPERRKNNNEDLISRSELLNYLKTHWSDNVIEVIQTFEKAEYLD